MSIKRFDENKFKYDSFYKDDVAVTRLKFGHDVPILETELNELQILQQNKMLSFFKKIIPTGFLNIKSESFNGEEILFCPPNENDNLLFNKIAIAPFEAYINGYELIAKGNFSCKGHNDYILIDLGEAPEYSERNDFVYLEVWFESVKGTETFTKYGYQDGDSSEYSALDNRINDETSRRISLCWNIRVAKDVKFDTYPNGFGYKNKIYNSPIRAIANGNCIEQNPGDYIFAEASNDIFKGCSFYNDKNLYVAGRPGVVQKDSSLYGQFIFAIPMFRVKRRNSKPYSIKNYNGSISYTHALTSNVLESYEKGDLNNNIRPDLLFYDYIVKEDLIDLRRIVELSDLKANNLLNESIKDLFNNELTTNENEKMKRIQIGNISPNYNSNLVNLFIKFNNSIKPLFINENNPIYNVSYKDDIERPLIYQKSVNNYGLNLNGKYKINYNLYNDDANALIGTLEFYMQPFWFGCDENVNQQILKINGNYDKEIINFKKKGKYLVFDFTQYKVNNNIEEKLTSTIEVNLENTLLMAKNIYHVRLSWSTQESITKCFLYINGKLVGQENIYTYNNVMPKFLEIGAIEELNNDGFIIEDLILYNKTFEENLGDIANKVFVNKFWNNLPEDYVESDTIILPSFDGKSNILSDNETVLTDVIYYGKIIENVLNLNLTNNSKVDQNKIPKIYDKNGVELIGNWTGLGTSNAKFSLSQTPNGVDVMPDEDEIRIVETDLSLMTDIIKYEYNDEFTNFINNNIIIDKPQNMLDKNYAIVVSDVLAKTLKIYDVTDKLNPVLLYDDVMKDGIDIIPGYILNLQDKEMDVLIANNTVTTLKSFSPIIIRPDINFELFGNIEHVHYSEKFKELIEASIQITNDADVKKGKYMIYVKSLDDNKIYIRDVLNKKEIYEGNLTDPITCIDGLNIQINGLSNEIVNYDGVIFDTIQTDIKPGSFYISSDVNPLYNYDASLKDHICETLQILDQNALLDASYEFVIVSLDPMQIRISSIDKNSKTILYEGQPKVSILDIPGLVFDCMTFPKYSYIGDSIIINTIAKTGTIPGHVEFTNTIKYDDNYSEIFKDFMTPNISLNDEFLLVDNYYNLTITNSAGTEFKIENAITGEFICDGKVGSQDIVKCIPGLNILFNTIPPKCNKNDSILIKTNAIKFENVKYEWDKSIPFVHFSNVLYNSIYDSIKIENLSAIEDEHYVIQLIDKDNEIIQIRRLSGEILYNGKIGHNLDYVPGLLFNVIDTFGIDQLGTVIITTIQTIIGIDAIVQYDSIISNGNAGFDIQNEILSAGIINNNFEHISEISFNRKGDKPRKIPYIRPRLVNGLYDEAYDFSNSYTINPNNYDLTDLTSAQQYYDDLGNQNHDGYVRRLTYRVTGRDITTYYIDKYLYGYEVIGIITVKSKKIIDCKLINNPENPLKKCFEITLDSVDIGETLTFELALGGISFDYDTNTKMLMGNICKTYNIEFESNGSQNYEIPLNISKYGYGLIKSLYSIKGTNLKKFDNNNNLLVNTFKYVAYVDDSLFIDSNYSGSDQKVMAEYTVDPITFEKPILKIQFKDYPKKGTKIRIPVLAYYYPTTEVFSLWYKNIPYQGTMKTEKVNLQRLTDWKFFMTTLSSGSYHDLKNFNNIINRLPGGLIYSYKIGGNNIEFSNCNLDIDNNRFVFLNNYYTNDLNSNNFLIDTNITINKTSKNFQDAKITLDNDIKIYFNDLSNAINKYIGGYCLVKNQHNELMVLIIGDLVLNESTKNVLSPKYGDLFKIKNNPII